MILCIEPENLDKHYNLVPEYDFKQVYRTLLTDWFGLDESEASATLGNEFEKIPFFEFRAQFQLEIGNNLLLSN